MACPTQRSAARPQPSHHRQTRESNSPAEPSCRPIADATVRLLLLDGEEEPEEIYRATTDAKGFHRVDVAVPDCESDAASLILEAESPFGPAETVIPISND